MLLQRALRSSRFSGSAGLGGSTEIQHHQLASEDGDEKMHTGLCVSMPVLCGVEAYAQGYPDYNLDVTNPVNQQKKNEYTQPAQGRHFSVFIVDGNCYYNACRIPTSAKRSATLTLGQKGLARFRHWLRACDRLRPGVRVCGIERKGGAV